MIRLRDLSNNDRIEYRIDGNKITYGRSILFDASVCSTETILRELMKGKMAFIRAAITKDNA